MFLTCKHSIQVVLSVCFLDYKISHTRAGLTLLNLQKKVSIMKFNKSVIKCVPLVLYNVRHWNLIIYQTIFEFHTMQGWRLNYRKMLIRLILHSYSLTKVHHNTTIGDPYISLFIMLLCRNVHLTLSIKTVHARGTFHFSCRQAK